MEYSNRPHSDEAGRNGAVPPVGVFVSERQAKALQEQIDAATRVLLLVRSVEPHESIAFDKLGDLDVAVLEVDQHDRSSVARLVQLLRSKPSFPVIAAIASPDMALVRTLVREGVADVVGLPLVATELTQTCLDAIVRQARPAAHVQSAPLVAVVRSSGGCGATTVATHLSAELARITSGSRKVLMADLDLQYGSVGHYLGVQRSGSLPDLIASEDRLDEELLHALAPETKDGMAVLSIPAEVPSSDSIPMEGLLRVIQALRNNYGQVVIDFPPNWSNWSASIAYSADIVLLVCELSLTSILKARRCIDLFDVIGIDPDKVQVVVNKVEKKMFRPIDTSDVGQTLGRSIIATLPRDGGDLARAQDQGMLVGEIARRNDFANALAGLAQAVSGKLGLKGER